MRIAYILTSLGRGGAERQVISLAERMAARGHSVVLLVLRPPHERDWPTSLAVIRLNMRKSPVGICMGLARGRRHLSRFDPHIIHSHTFPANLAARILRASYSKPAVLSTIHNVYEGGWQRTVLYRVTGRLADHTTGVSEAVTRHHIASHAVTHSKCSVITNGIDTTVFKPSTARRVETRAQFNVADRFVWLAAGRLTAAKNYPTLLRAFSRLHVEFPRAELWIAGQGTVLEKRRLRVLAEATGISSAVRWLGLRDDLPVYLDAADAFVLSSSWEGMPLVIGEAMAMQKPVVATDVGGVRELVGDAGIIVPPNDPNALAEGMIRVLSMSEDQRPSMGNRARRRTQQQFNINEKADEWQALYAELLQHRVDRKARLCAS